MLSLTWFVVRLVLVLGVGEGESWVLPAGEARAAAGLDVVAGPQLDDLLRWDRALWVGVRIGAGAQRVATLQEADVWAVRVLMRARFTNA